MAETQRRVFMVRVDLRDKLVRDALIDHLIVNRHIVAKSTNEKKNSEVRAWLDATIGSALDDVVSFHPTALTEIAAAQERAEEDKILARAEEIMRDRAIERDDEIYATAGGPPDGELPIATGSE